MRTVQPFPSDEAMVRAVLEGGPDDIPTEQRDCYAPVDSNKIKVVHRGGHEHFERVAAGTDAAPPVVFRWTTRTRIAE